LEQDPRAKPISSIKNAKGASSNGKGIVIIGGNEESGVDPGLLDICDKILFLPMRGKKRSFNVAVAYGIAIGILTQKLKR
jgi:tRNA G18 (ribose-2'-O)-methylase SpoU